MSESVVPPDLKPGQQLRGMPPELLGAILRHPGQQAVVERVDDLITWLRDCSDPIDFNEFQRHVFGDVYQAEERRSKCRQAVRRLESLKRPAEEVVELIGVTVPHARQQPVQLFITQLDPAREELTDARLTDPAHPGQFRLRDARPGHHVTQQITAARPT